MDNYYAYDKLLLNMRGNSYYFHKKTMERLSDSRFLEGYGFKVYSQNDEDGIIQEIFNRIGIKNKLFIEIGIQDGLECNTHYLLFQGWHGVWIEADEDNFYKASCRFARVADCVGGGGLKIVNSFITSDNINDVIKENADEKAEIDLFSIDIDGNDYYVLKELSVISPRVIVTEYNGKFPPPTKWVMPYDAEHIWDKTDVHGASLSALTELLADKGYDLVGTNLNGINAFFVRKDLLKNNFHYTHTAEALYNPARIGRASGSLMFQNGEWPAKYFCGNGLDDATHNRLILNIKPISLNEIYTLTADKIIYIWGAGVVGQLCWEFLSRECAAKLYFCDIKKLGAVNGCEICNYNMMETAYDENNTIVLLASCDSVYEMAYRAISRGKIQVLYSALPILQTLAINDSSVMTLWQQYKSTIENNKIFKIGVYL